MQPVREQTQQQQPAAQQRSLTIVAFVGHCVSTSSVLKQMHSDPWTNLSMAFPASPFPWYRYHWK